MVKNKDQERNVVSNIWVVIIVALLTVSKTPWWVGVLGFDSQNQSAEERVSVSQSNPQDAESVPIQSLPLDEHDIFINRDSQSQNLDIAMSLSISEETRVAIQENPPDRTEIVVVFGERQRTLELWINEQRIDTLERDEGHMPEASRPEIRSYDLPNELNWTSLSSIRVEAKSVLYGSQKIFGIQRINLIYNDL